MMAQSKWMEGGEGGGGRATRVPKRIFRVFGFKTGEIMRHPFALRDDDIQPNGLGRIYISNIPAENHNRTIVPVDGGKVDEWAAH
jgi:hypothetical protein